DLNYPFGTDSLGRCVLSRLIFGARTAMLVALFASLGAMIIGTVLAHVSGYFGGTVDWLIGRLVDIWMSFPPVILSLILMVGLGVGLSKVILAIVLVDWTRFCRVLRSEVLIVTRHDYVAAARLLGFTHWQTIVREVLPATTPLLITLISLEMAIAVVVEAILSFIGLGVGANTPAWGQMIAGARQYFYQSPWNLLLPIFAIFLTVTAFNLLGDGLRRTLDVRLAETGRLASWRRKAKNPWSAPASTASRCRRSAPCRSICRREKSSAWSANPAPANPWSAAPSRSFCRPASRSRPGHCCSKAKTFCAWRRARGVRCSAAPSPSSRRRRCPRSIRCAPSARNSTSIWRGSATAAAARAATARSPC